MSAAAVAAAAVVTDAGVENVAAVVEVDSAKRQGGGDHAIVISRVLFDTPIRWPAVHFY